jgi:hypothetical protein
MTSVVFWKIIAKIENLSAQRAQSRHENALSPLDSVIEPFGVLTAPVNLDECQEVILAIECFRFLRLAQDRPMTSGVILNNWRMPSSTGNKGDDSNVAHSDLSGSTSPKSLLNRKSLAGIPEFGSQ